MKEHIRESLQQSCSLAELDCWFEPLKLEFNAESAELTVFFPHIYFEEWFVRHGKINFERCAQDTALRLIGRKASIRYQDPETPPSKAFFFMEEEGASGGEAEYSLDTFIVNAKNEFPLAAAKEVCNPEARHWYNPFVLYGKSGTGKTHLARALAAALGAVHGQTRVFSGNAETLAETLFKRGTHVFLQAHTAMVVDDVQRLSRNLDAQEKLVRIMDACLDDRRQMVFACSGPPSSLEDVAESLRSRLQVGLMVELKEPDIDVRMRFAQWRCRQHGIRLDKSQLLSLAQRCKHIRHLSGVILKLAAFHCLAQRPITTTDMENVLRSSGEEKPLTPENIINAVAERYGVPVKDIMGGKRRSDCVRARQTAMFLCRELLGASYPALGKIFGGKDHSTVMHSIKKIKQMMDTNKETHSMVTELKKKCMTR